MDEHVANIYWNMLCVSEATKHTRKIRKQFQLFLDVDTIILYENARKALDESIR